MGGREHTEFFEDVLVLVELTELAARVPAGAREQWALHCAKRAIGDDIPAMRPHRALLQGWRLVGELQLKHRLNPDARDYRDVFEQAQQGLRELLDELQQELADSGPSGGRARVIAAATSLVWALRCVEGHSDHEAAARAAQGAFEDPGEEARNQARFLLTRSKLTPTGAELLVRLDYAESLGALPREPDQRAWLDAQRELLMNEDEGGRLAVVFRYLDKVFLAELARAR